MAFAIKRQPPSLLPTLYGTNFHPFFSFSIESCIYETDFRLGLSQKNITFKYFYKWYKTKTFLECNGQNLFRTVEKSLKNQAILSQ